MRRMTSTLAIATFALLLPLTAMGTEEPEAAAELERTAPVAPEQAPGFELEPAGDDQLPAVDPLQGAEEKAEACYPDCPEEPSPFSCRDSDGGKRPSTNGTLYFSYYGQVTGVYTDYCNNGTNLTEYWCSSSSQWTTTTYWCGNGCSAGRCL